MNDINWRKGEDLGCITEGEYILEVDLHSTLDRVVTRVIHAYYIKPGRVFVDLNDFDAPPIEPEDVVRWVPFKSLSDLKSL